MITRIEHVAIDARVPAALARWYRDTLGFRVLMEGQGERGTWFVAPPGAGAEGGAFVEIEPANDAPATAHVRDDAGLRHLAFAVDDFEGTCDALRAKGVPFVGDVVATPDGKRLAFFADPEGNLLQLVHRPRPAGT